MLTTAAPGTNSSKTSLKPYVYLAEQIPLAWEALEPFMQRAVAAGRGEITVEVIYQMLVNQEALAFVTLEGDKVEAMLVVRLIDYSTYRAARIIACSGRRLAEAMQFIDALEAWALTQGAVEIEAWCRPAMTRLVRRFGWQPKLAIVSRDLRRKLQ